MFRVAIIGKGALPVRSAELLRARGHEVAALVGDDPALRLWAEFEHIPWSARAESLPGLIQNQPIDFLFSLNNVQVLSAEILKLPQRGAINFHDALLPRYAGLQATTWAVLHREPVHGITWHRMEEGIDTGPILAQRRFPISPDETTFSLNLKVYRAAEESLVGLIEALESGTVQETPQDMTQRTYFSARHPFPDDAILDWKQTAEELDVRVRALDSGSLPNPWRGMRFWTGQEWVFVRGLEARELSAGLPPGTFVRGDDVGWVVAVADRLVFLRRFLSESGEAFDPRALAASLGLQPGDRFPELPSVEPLRPPARKAEKDPGPSLLGALGLTTDQSWEDGVAMESSDGRAWSRRDLRQRIRKVADGLRVLGLEPEEKVGLCVPRSPEMVEGLLGTLAAGGAYVPLDPQLPEARLRGMAEESRLRFLLVTRETADWAHALGLQGVILEDVMEGNGVRSLVDADVRGSGGNLAYVLYTSGSTGKPKGVLLEQRAVIQYIRAAQRDFHYTTADRILQFASLGFDTAGEEIYPALASGATLVLRDEDMISSPARFLRRCAELRLTVLNLPTSFWHELVAWLEENNGEIPPHVRLVIIGGEAARVDRVRSWTRRVGQTVRLVNTYGATEVGMVATHHELTDGQGLEADMIPIGRPVEGVVARILDAALEPVPRGEWGELCLGGNGLARGYWGRHELTRSRFIADPLSPQGRLFRTGDWGRWNPQDVLEVRGRRDLQFKWRGHRIEPEEIEHALRLHPEIQEAVVTLSTRSLQETVLAAYLVARGKTLALSGVRRHLESLLPTWMVPARFVVLDRLPLTASHKIDREALRDRTEGTVNTASKSPDWTSPTEARLAGLWKQLLGSGEFAAEDDFFERGGDSLLGIRLLGWVEKEFGVGISVRDFLTAKTLGSLARLIEAKGLGQRTLELVKGFRHLVPLRLEEEAVGTLFIVPGGWGRAEELLVYANWVAAFSDKIRVYGFVANPDDAYPDVATMAKAYREEMKRLRGAGPCWILGECLGVAGGFELCRQLQEAGTPAQALVLLDGQYLSGFRRWKLWWRNFIGSREFQRMKGQSVRRFSRWRRYCASRPVTEWPRIFLDAAHRQIERWRAMGCLRSDHFFIENEHLLQWRYMKNLQSYRISDHSLSIPAALFFSEETHRTLSGRASWERKLAYAAVRNVLRGTHEGYIREHAVESCREVQAFLRGLKS